MSDNQMIVDINIDKKEKIKINQIFINGNEHLSDKTIRKAMKKTRERSTWANRFRNFFKGGKKFITEKYEEDKDLIIEAKSFNIDDAFKAAESFLKKGKDFTAIFSIADAMGIAAIKALHTVGLNVPDDCSLIAIDGIQVSKYTIPTLTTLVQPSKQMGTLAVEVLLNVLKDECGSCQLKLETALREGGTLAKPKA